MIISSTKMKLTDKFDFGKYSGQKLEDIINTDPQYVWWCKDNIKDFDLTKNADMELSESDRSSPYDYLDIFDLLDLD